MKAAIAMLALLAGALLGADVVAQFAGETGTVLATQGLHLSSAQPPVLELTGPIVGPWTLAPTGPSALSVINGTVDLTAARGVTLDVYVASKTAITQGNNLTIPCETGDVVVSGGCDCRGDAVLISGIVDSNDAWLCWCDNSPVVTGCGIACHAAYALCLRQ